MKTIQTGVTIKAHSCIYVILAVEDIVLNFKYNNLFNNTLFPTLRSMTTQLKEQHFNILDN